MTYHRITNIALGAAYTAAFIVICLDLFYWRPG